MVVFRQIWLFIFGNPICQRAQLTQLIELIRFIFFFGQKWSKFLLSIIVLNCLLLFSIRMFLFIQIAFNGLFGGAFKRFVYKFNIIKLRIERQLRINNTENSTSLLLQRSGLRSLFFAPCSLL